MGNEPFDGAIVQEIDPTLLFRVDLYPEGTSSWTVMVEREGKRCVLKVRRKSHNIWDQRYFHYEISALRRAAERGLNCVTRLHKVYDTELYQALLKEYVEGTPGNRLDSEGLLQDPDFVAKLDRLYLELHLAGIAKVCFEPRKVVVREDREITLVDLSSCVISSEVGVLLFSQAMRDDGRFITGLEKQIRRKNAQHTSLLSRMLGRG